MEPMWIFIFVKALLVQTIDNRSCSGKNGNRSNVFSCIGCTVVLDCAFYKTDSNPLWSRSGNPIFMHDERLQIVEKDNFNLQILDIKKSDEDKYCCYAIYRNVSKQHCVWLQIIELLILPNDNTIVGISGSTVTATCSIIDNIPGAKNISWIRNGKTVSSSESNILTLTVVLAKNLNTQNVKCKAVIDCIDMSLEQDVKFNVTYAPRVKVTAFPSSKLNERDNMNLTCTYDANPYPSLIRWIKNDNVISYDAAYQKLNISREDNGLYACNVSNTIGHGVDKVQINVNYALDVNVVHLLNGSLYCNATGVPMNYTFCKWEHQSFNGQHLRYLQVQSAMLTVDLEDDNPVYKLNGRYLCTVTNGVADSNNVSLQKAYKDVIWFGRPWCILSNPDLQYGQQRENVTLIFHVYSGYNITNYEFFKADKKLEISSKYKFLSNISRLSVNVYERNVQINITIISLEIFSMTQSDFNASYTLRVYTNYGKETCVKKLRKGSFPQKPTEFGVKAYKNGILVNWMSRFDGGYPKEFVIKYRFVLAETWSVQRAKTSNCTSERLCTALIKGIRTYVQYIVYMYAENELGKSSITYPVTIEIKTFTSGSQQQNNSIFSEITEKLLISFTSTLLLIVTFCYVFGRQYRRNRINTSSSRNQAQTSNTANNNGHYEEIDGALERNVDNSSSPGNDQIELHEMRGAEHNLVLLQTSIQTMQETVDQAMRDISKQALTETITQVIRETQLEIISALRENSDSQICKRRSSVSSGSELDANDEHHETRYPNIYQPLQINVASCEHPYTETSLKDAPLDIGKKETKHNVIDDHSSHSENAVSEV